jgi:glycosyltransferase involved in cell wall biosynthesis
MKKVAVVYDWLDKWGGVERVLLTLHEMFPQADFYTSYYDLKKASWAKNLNIKTSFIQKLPNFVKSNRLLSFPFYPYAFESFDFSGYDLVISVTSSFAKSIITKPGTFHLCYLLTPTRYLWLYPQEYFSSWQRILMYRYIKMLKKWDRIAAQRPDKIMAISKTVADRCKTNYGRKAEVVYPGFDMNYWSHFPSESEGSRDEQKFYLIVSRLEPYKKVELAIEVFNKMKDKELVVVGVGSQLNKLRSKAGKNIRFLEKVTDEELVDLYCQAEAVIMPQEEDFGYVALEAQYFGCPVIAYGKGGATETVVNGKTGLFFQAQTVKSLGEALERYGIMAYNLKVSTQSFGREVCDKFNKERFEKSFYKFIEI